MRALLFVCVCVCVAHSLKLQGNTPTSTGCTADWHRFDEEQLLNASAVVVAAAEPQTFEHGYPTGLFVDPASNFAFCLIEKNACSAWNRVLHNVLTKDAA